MSKPEYVGTCFCGAVELTVTGEPDVIGYCHCSSCRQWSGSPVNAFTLWKQQAVRVTRGEEKVASYNKTPHTFRSWCKVCGGHLFAEHPGLGLTDVFAAVIPDFPFDPTLHIHYGESVIFVRDALPRH